MYSNLFLESTSKIVCIAMIFLACNAPEDTFNDLNDNSQEIESPEPKKSKYTYLALGDSYTIGQNVRHSESFPAQLEKLLEKSLGIKISTDRVAKTGWRTDDLLRGIENSSLQPPYDFATLLIGVNNQYQGQPFSQFEEEFPKLLDIALELIGKEKGRLIIVSIPDYAYTPFSEGRNRQKISEEIDRYNAFAKKTAQQHDVTFVNITDIGRNGLDQPELVANDGLHHSGKAYAMFASRIAPFIVSRLKD